MSDRSEESATPVTQTAVKDVKVGGNFLIGNINQIGTYIQALLPNQEREELEARRKLLRAIKSDVEALLKQSLYKNKKINLLKELRSRQVESRRAQGIIRALPEIEPLSTETRIIDIFNEASQRLLILGVPGAGKTIALLELTLELIDRAEATLHEPNAPREPIPILLNLATWQADHQSITYWIIEELKSKYGVRRDLGRRWLKQRHLLPLLDELDRLSTKHQEVCIAAVNDLLRQEDHPEGLVVCSRLEEYKSYSAKFKLEEALCINSLTETQIREYLIKSIGQSDLWKKVQDDSDLLESVKSPLFLSILVWTLAPQENSRSQQHIATEEWSRCKSIKERRQYFFKIFIEQMLDKELVCQHYPKGKEPSADNTRIWLIHLARIVKEKSPTDFLIENMQPNWWFITEAEERGYSLTVRLLVGLISGFTAGLYLYGWSHELAVWLFAVLAGLVTGTLSHYCSYILNEFPDFFSRLLSKVIPGFIFFAFTFILNSFISATLIEGWPWLALLTGLGVGTAFYDLSPQQINAADKVEFSFSRAVQYTCLSLILGILFIPFHFFLQPEFYAENPKYFIFELIAFSLPH